MFVVSIVFSFVFFFVHIFFHIWSLYVKELMDAFYYFPGIADSVAGAVL